MTSGAATYHLPVRLNINKKNCLRGLCVFLCRARSPRAHEAAAAGLLPHGVGPLCRRKRRRRANVDSALSRRREIVWTMTEAAARTRSDVDSAFFTTALSRRREIVWTRTEAAARTRSDVDSAFFSTALSRRREIVWTRTEAAARTRSDVDSALGRRREIVWTRTEAAARTRSDVDSAFFSTALSRRREIVWTRTEAAARTRSNAYSTFFSTATRHAVGTLSYRFTLKLGHPWGTPTFSNALALH